MPVCYRQAVALSFGFVSKAGSTSHNSEDCFRFIEHILSYSTQKYLADYFYSIPARKRIIPDGISGRQYQCQKYAVEHGEHFWSANPFIFHVRRTIELEIERWLKFGGDPGQMLARIEENC